MKSVIIKLTVGFIIITILSGVIAYNLDDLYLINKGNAIIYFPDNLFSGTQTSLLIQTTDVEGFPKENEHVSVLLITKNKTYHLFEGKTDESGSAQAIINVPDFTGEATLLIHAAGTEIERRIEVKETYRILISTDKPIYQPGQIVHIRILSFQGIEPKASNKEVKLEINDPNGNIIYRKVLIPNEYGIASVDFSLSEQLPLGNYKIEAEVGGKKVEKTVIVKKYVLPKFSINFEGLKSWYLVNERIKGKIICNYFFGKEVEGNVNISVKAYYGIWKEVSRASGRLEDGEFDFNFDPVGYVIGIPFEKGSGLIRLDVGVTDEGGHKEKKSISLPISGKPILLTLITDKNVLNTRSIYYIIAKYPDGSPVRDADVKIPIGNDGNYFTRTDDRGIAKFEFIFHGEDSINISVVKDNYSIRETFFLHSSDGLKIIPEKTTYNIGERAKFDVIYKGDSLTDWVFYDIASKGFIVTTGKLKLEDGRGNFSVTVSPDMIPLAKVRVYKTQQDLKVVKDTAVIGITSPNKLEVEITKDKDQYLPHEPITLHFKIKDKDKPVVSALGISIVDKSVFEISERFCGIEKLYFALEEDFIKPQYEIHEYVFSNSRILTPARNVPKEVQIGDFGSETSIIKTWQRDIERASILREYAIKKFWQGLAFSSIFLFLVSFVIADYRVLKKYGKTPALVIFLVFVVLLSIATSISTYLLMPISSPPPVVVEKGMVMDMQRAPGIAIRSEMVKTSMERAMKKEEKSIGEEEYARQFFPETWYWEPVLITDEKGEASISLITPDSITSWEVSLIASTKDARFGTGNQEITVFKEFFIEPDIPSSAIRGEKFPLGVMIYNYDKKDHEINVKIMKSDWFELLSNPEKIINVKSKSVSRVEFNIIPRSVGKHNLTIYAFSDAKKDAIIKEMRIEPDGKALTDIKNGELKNEQTVMKNLILLPNRVPESEDAFVKIQGGMESVILDGAEGFMHFVSGCGEQSLSRLSVDILAYQNLMKKKGITEEQMFKYENMITQGIQHELIYLKEGKKGGRGIVWFPHDEDAHPWLTSWGLLTFQDARSAGYTIDDKIIEDMQTFLLKLQKNDGSFEFPEWGLYETTNPILKAKKVATTSYIIHALTYSGYSSKSEEVRRAIDFIEKNIRDNWDDPYTLSLALIVLEDANGDKKLRDEIADRLIELKEKENGTFYWTSRISMYSNVEGRFKFNERIIETTGYAIMALQKHGDIEIVRKAIDYLLTHRNAIGGFFTTQDTIVAFQALNNFGSIPIKDLTINAYINDRLIKTIHLTEANKDLTYFIDLRPYLKEKNLVELKSEGEGIALYQIYMEQYLPWKILEFEKPSELLLNVTYDAKKIRVNDILKAHCKIKYQGKAEEIRMVLIDLRAPVGFSFIEEDFKSLVNSDTIDNYEIKGRQALVYIEGLKRGDTVEFDYRLRAEKPIKGVIQGVKAFDMYNMKSKAEMPPVEITSFV